MNNDNPFIEKFESKSDLELESIASDTTSFVYEARYAALTILKKRNYHSAITETAEKESKKRKAKKNREIAELKVQDERLVRRLRYIAIKGMAEYRLKNGNDLLVKRLSEDMYQVRIRNRINYEGLGPVIICEIKDSSSYLCYPFLYLKPIFIFGIGGLLLNIILYGFDYIEKDMLIFFLPLMVIIGLQLLLMPFMYYITLFFFKARLRKK